MNNYKNVVSPNQYIIMKHLNDYMEMIYAQEFYICYIYIWLINVYI